MKDLVHLKKRSYSLLKKLHDIERVSKARKLFSKMSDEKSYVSICVTKTYECLSSSFSGVHDEIAKGKIRNFERAFTLLIANIDESSQNNHVINKRLVSKLLSLHTDLFSYLRDNKIDLEFDRIQWNEIGTLATIVWNKQRFLRNFTLQY